MFRPRTRSAIAWPIAGPRRSLGDDPDAPWVVSTAPRHAHLAGFDLHANVAVPAANRARLEQLCRYLLRPAVAQDRLRRLTDGRVVLTLKTAWADGTRHLICEPLTLLEKLAALTPRPRINLILYHGVLAPHAGWRARVVAYDAPPVEAPGVASAAADVNDAPTAAPNARHWAWALDRHGRGSRRDPRDPGRRRGGAGAGGPSAAPPRVAERQPDRGDQRLSAHPGAADAEACSLASWLGSTSLVQALSAWQKSLDRPIVRAVSGGAVGAEGARLSG